MVSESDEEKMFSPTPSRRRRHAKREKSVVIALAVLLLLIASSFIYLFSNISKQKQDLGSAVINVGIGPISPVCTANSTAISNAANDTIILQDPYGTRTRVPIRLTEYNRCSLIGTAEVSLAKGIYGVNLASCLSQNRRLGCNSLPTNLTVIANMTTTLNVSIDTGIR